MRIHIGHLTRYDYDRPAKGVIQILRLTPRPFEGLHVLTWRLEVDGDVRLNAGEDALGNITHTFSAGGPLKRLTARVKGEVETLDTGGVLRGSVERFPPMVFLRETHLTQADQALRAYTHEAVPASGTTLNRLHALLGAIHRDLSFDTSATEASTSAAEAFALRRGVCQDLSQVFISCARLIGVPARYVSGHLVRADQPEQSAAHAWAEAFVEGLGWVGFDAANGVCPTDAYVRVAVGLDYLSAAPVRGSRQGGGKEQLQVKLRIEPTTPRRY